MEAARLEGSAPVCGSAGGLLSDMEILTDIGLVFVACIVGSVIFAALMVAVFVSLNAMDNYALKHDKRMENRIDGRFKG